MADIEFVPIDLENTRKLCVKFRRDSFATTLPEGESAFLTGFGGVGEESYLKWLERILKDHPEGCKHLLHDGEIVGQIESRFRELTREGYVHLFYLVPSHRGRGLGKQLHDFVKQRYLTLGATHLALTTHPFNTSAVAFYRRLGWVDRGPPNDRPQFQRFEYPLI